MRKKGTMFYSALLLTGANLALRMVSMGFQVYLSGRIGAAGIGLMQLVLSVSTLAMTAAMAGVRTSAMYLTAEEIGRGHGAVGQVRDTCFVYSLCFSCLMALGVYFFAPAIAEGWIGDRQTVAALRVFALFLPVVCLVGVMTGCFTAAGRIRELVVTELLEQGVCMALTVALLANWAHHDPGRSCTAVVAGSSLSSALTLGILLTLWYRRRSAEEEKREPMVRRLLQVALPLAVADDLRMGINTVENLIVPRRLSRYPHSAVPLADYGIVCGMVFPVLMFPASILFSLSELLVPELSRCAAGNRKRRISYLTGRSLRVALLYGLAAGGVLYTAANSLGILLYDNPAVGVQLKKFALLAPMLYVDAVTDANIKGMGQQVACVRYNTLTSFLDVVFLWILLPRYGLDGYFASFLGTHALNFFLSVRRLRRVTGFAPDLGQVARAVAAASFAAWMGRFLPQAQGMGGVLFQAAGFLGLFGLAGILLGAFTREDMAWVRGLVHPAESAPPAPPDSGHKGRAWAAESAGRLHG